MRIALLTCAALVAFAANSLLNRAAIAEAGADPAVFTGLRLVSGAVTLAALVTLRQGAAGLRGAGSWPSAAALAVYAVAFSFAYVRLDAGLGALVLFGTVQVVMFGGALARGQQPGRWRWLGSALGIGGLSVLFLPGAAQPATPGVLLMMIAGAAWGVYSLRGQAAGDPLVDTAGNFLWAAPVGVLLMLPMLWLGWPSGGAVLLAVASGAVASGLGYAVWYAVLPRLEPSLAAIAQLTVPLIALSGGVLLLGEAVTWAFALAACLILGGVALAIYDPTLGGRAAARGR
ncbi:MAG: DMT family transporter [Pseudomonadota bacterium]